MQLLTSYAGVTSTLSRWQGIKPEGSSFARCAGNKAQGCPQAEGHQAQGQDCCQAQEGVPPVLCSHLPFPAVQTSCLENLCRGWLPAVEAV